MAVALRDEGTVWRLLLAYFFLCIGFTLLPTLLTLRLATAGTPASVVGLLAATPWLAILLTAPFVSRITARFGLKPSYLVSGLVPLLCIIGFATVDHLAAWFCFNALSGCAGAVSWIVAESWVAGIAPPGRRGLFVGLFEMMVGLAFVAGPTLVWATGTEGSLPFVLAGAAEVIGYLLVASCPPPASSQHALHEPAPAIDGAHLSRHHNAHHSAMSGDSGAPRSLIRRQPLMLAGLVVASTIGGLFEAGSSSTLSLFALGVGLSAGGAALAATALGLGSALLQLPLGALADRVDAMRIAWICAVLTTLATACLLLAPQWPLTLHAVAMVWGGISGGLYTLAMIRVGKTFRDQDLVQGTSAVVFSYTAGGAIGPVLGGLLIEHQPDIGVPVGFGVMALTGTLLLGVLNQAARRRERRRQ